MACRDAIIGAGEAEMVGGGDEVDEMIETVANAELAEDKGVRAGPALQDVVAGITGDDVGQCIAGAVDGGRAGESQVFDIGPPSVNVIDDWTVSVPSLAFSLAWSKLLLTT